LHENDIPVVVEDGGICLMTFLAGGAQAIFAVACLHDRRGDVTPVREDQQAKLSATAELRV